MKTHYVPSFADSAWASDETGRGGALYERGEHQRRVVRDWDDPIEGERRQDPYALNHEGGLAGEVATTTRLYEKLLRFEPLDFAERLQWSRFLLSQFTSTASFTRYEATLRARGLTTVVARDRVGRQDSHDACYVATRDWRLLLAHADEFFILADNPVMITGFLRRPRTVLLYPLSPRICFVACSMPTPWDPVRRLDQEVAAFDGVQLEPAAASFLTLQFARCADSTAIVHPRDDAPLCREMLTRVLGTYPQPPFLLREPAAGQFESAFRSIRQVMTATDRIYYSEWNHAEIEPYLGFSGRWNRPHLVEDFG